LFAIFVGTLMNPLRPANCRVCGSTKIHVVYRSHDVVYLACGDCDTLRAVEMGASAVETCDEGANLNHTFAQLPVTSR
jgi:hypothetical protein